MQLAAKAAEAAEEFTAAATMVAAAAKAKAVTAGGAAAVAPKEAGEKAAEHALLERRELKLATGALRDQAEEEALRETMVQPIRRLPPARKHAEGSSKALTSPPTSPELLQPEAMEMLTGGGLKNVRDAIGMRVFRTEHSLYTVVVPPSNVNEILFSCTLS